MTDQNKNVPVIVFANQKGGVGKTTSADAVIEGFRDRGLKVLAIDMDTQNSLGDLQRRYILDDTPTSTAFIMGEDVVTKDGQATLPGEDALTNLQDLFDKNNKPIEYSSLKSAIDRAVEAHGFDVVVIDTHPGMGFAEVSSAYAATHIVIPTTADRLGINALLGTNLSAPTGEFSQGGMGSFLASVQETCGSDWKAEPAVLITKFRSMASIDRKCAASMRKQLPEEGYFVFDQIINLNTIIQQCQLNGCSIYEARGRSSAVAQYNCVTDTIMEWVGLEPKNASVNENNGQEWQ